MLSGTQAGNRCRWFSFWKCKSVMDKQLACQLLNGAATVADAPAQSGLGYMYDFSREHAFRNNTTACEIQLQFWILKARRDVANSFSGAVSTPSIPAVTPAATNNYLDAVLLDPPLLTEGFSQPTQPTITGTGAPIPTAVFFSHIDATPYMSQVLAQSHKIEPYKVFPPRKLGAKQKKRFIVTLLPGEEISFTFKSTKAMQESYRKYGVANTSAVPTERGTLVNAYQELTDTNVVLCKMMGALAHRVAPNFTTVETGLGKVDYQARVKWNHIFCLQKAKSNVTFTVGQPTDSDLVQTNLVSGILSTQQPLVDPKPGPMDEDEKRPDDDTGSLVSITSTVKRMSVGARLDLLLEDITKLKNEQSVWQDD